MSETNQNISPDDKTRNEKPRLTASKQEGAQPQLAVVSPQDFHFYTQPLAPNRRLSGRDNYYAWMVNLESNLESLGLMRCIEGNETDQRLIKRARALIIRNVSDDVLFEVRHMGDPCEMWKYLEEAYDVSKNPSELSRAEDMLREMSILDYDSMDDYYRATVRLFNILRRSNSPRSEESEEIDLVSGISRDRNGRDGFWDGFISHYFRDADAKGPGSHWHMGLLEVRKMAERYHDERQLWARLNDPSYD